MEGLLQASNIVDSMLATMFLLAMLLWSLPEHFRPTKSDFLGFVEILLLAILGFAVFRVFPGNTFGSWRIDFSIFLLGTAVMSGIERFRIHRMHLRVQQYVEMTRIVH